MPKKKELPRKRKRFLKKVFFFSSLIGIILILGVGILYYTYFFKSDKPEFSNPLPIKTVVQANQEDLFLKSLKNALEKEAIVYTKITREKDGSYNVVLEKGGVVTFGPQKDIMAQIASLQYILSHLTMEGKLFSQLDLRFEKPVIKLRE